MYTTSYKYKSEDKKEERQTTKRGVEVEMGLGLVSTLLFADTAAVPSSLTLTLTPYGLRYSRVSGVLRGGGGAGTMNNEV